LSRDGQGAGLSPEPAKNHTKTSATTRCTMNPLVNWVGSVITMNMLLADPNSVRWEQRAKSGKPTIDGV